MGMQNKHIERKALIGTTLNNYKMIDVMKYVAAIMVICIHCNQLFPSEYLNFFVKQIVCRIAVPFFFICSAYLVRKRSVEEPLYVGTYLKGLSVSYALWSVAFIPIGLDWIHQNMGLPLNLLTLPIALVLGLVHVGIYYHLWFIPAMIISLFIVHKLVRKISYKTLFIVCFLLYVFGSVESYYGLLHEGWFKDFFDVFIRIVFTTRSALFYGMIYTLMGFYIFDRRTHLCAWLKYIPMCTLMCALLLIVEGSFIFTIVRLDVNFMIMLIPFSFCFFLWLLACPYIPTFDTRHIRKLSTYYYFIHPVCIVIVDEVWHVLGMQSALWGSVKFITIIALTHIASKRLCVATRPLRGMRVVWSAVFGLLLTYILACIFVYTNLANTVIKFEMAPSLWLYFGFIIYGIWNRPRHVGESE